MTIRLIRCDPDGNPIAPLAKLSADLLANCQASAALYRRLGYVEPWVSYVAVSGDLPVGGAAFVGPPSDGCVEIAYYTLPEYQNRGYAGLAAAGLLAIARTHDPSVRIKAYTLMERNPSVRILQKLGFVMVGTAHDADAGEVWEWRA